MDVATSPYFATGPSKKQSLKLLVFRVGALSLALSVDHIKKVMNYQPIASSGLHATGIARIEGQEITVVDLYKRLFHQRLNDLDQARYFIIAKTSQGEHFGLVVSEAPTIVDLPYDQIRKLPESYRQADTLEIASHVTMIAAGDDPRTVFIVEADRILPNVAKPSVATTA